MIDDSTFLHNLRDGTNNGENGLNVSDVYPVNIFEKLRQ